MVALMLKLILAIVIKKNQPEYHKYKEKTEGQ